MNNKKSSIRVLIIFLGVFLLTVAAFASASGYTVNLNLFSKATPIFDVGSYVEIMKGNVPGHSIINKFGRNPNVGTSITHISISGEYQTPKSPQSLEILSNSALDTIGGIGGQKIIILGLDGDFNEINETVDLNGTTPTSLTKQFMRVFRMYVVQSGSYVTTGTPSHYGVLTLRNVGAGVTWTQIETVNGFGIGQSQIGTYTVPAGKTAFLISKSFSVETNKPASVYFFMRQNSDDVVAPYTGIMRLFEQNDGIEAPFNIQPPAPMNKIEEKSEVGFFAIVPVTSASVSAEFQLLIVENKYL